MSDHLIAEAHRHAMALPTTHPTHADIAWYVREVSELRAEVEESKARERAAIASWDEERQRALREGGRVVELRAELALLREWQREVIQNANAHHAELKEAIAQAESAEREVERLKPYVSKAVLTHEGTMLCSPMVAVKFNEETARAERAEAELAGIRALADRRNKRYHVEDTTHQLVVALDQALDIAQDELADERARLADLVADLNDACITLASAAEDCDDYAMQNTGFKLTAVREVLLQHIPNAAMKEGA